MSKGAITTATGIAVGLVSTMLLGFAGWTTGAINSNNTRIQNVRVEMSAISARIEAIDKRTERIENKVDKIIIQNAR